VAIGSRRRAEGRSEAEQSRKRRRGKKKEVAPVVWRDGDAAARTSCSSVHHHHHCVDMPQVHRCAASCHLCRQQRSKAEEVGEVVDASDVVELLRPLM
jgi:hypothetical protein